MKKFCITAVAAISCALFAADYSLEKCNTVKVWRLTREIRRSASGKAYKFDGKEKAMRFDGPAIIVTRMFREIPAVSGVKLDKKFTGLAFKVKGCGVDEWGCITISGGPMKSGSFYFSVKDTNWREIRVPFSQLAPANDYNMEFNELSAIEVSEIVVGDRWRIREGNTDIKPFYCLIKDIRLTDDVFPAPAKHAPEKFENVIAKMKAGKKVQILCVGDSITAGTSLKMRETERYGAQLEKLLQKHFKNPGIKVRVCGVGGAHTFNSLVWQERDLAGEIPDVATMLIGYNNRSSCQTVEQYKQQLKLWIDRLAEKTGGKTAVILIPTVPGVPRFYAQRDLADATRKLAKELKLPIADIEKWILSLPPMEYRTKYLADSVHPNPDGHKKYAEILADLFIRQAK